MKLYDEREEELGDELMRALERYLLLQIIDQRWREHLYDMDYLREGIHLRGFAQIDPLVAYKNEGFALFQDLMNSIWSDFARMIYNVEVEVQAEDGAPDEALPQQRNGGGSSALNYSGGTLEDQPSAYGGEGYARRGRRAARGRRHRRPAAPRRRARPDRAQRPVLVRQRQEVQEVPRGLSARGGSGPWSGARPAEPRDTSSEALSRLPVGAGTGTSERSRLRGAGPARRAGSGGARGSARAARDAVRRRLPGGRARGGHGGGSARAAARRAVARRRRNALRATRSRRRRASTPARCAPRGGRPGFRCRTTTMTRSWASRTSRAPAPWPRSSGAGCPSTTSSRRRACSARRRRARPPPHTPSWAAARPAPGRHRARAGHAAARRDA